MSRRGIALLLLASVLGTGASLGLTACEKEEGPAEELGEAIDNAVDEAKDAAD